jgi:hypothetical protein
MLLFYYNTATGCMETIAASGIDKRNGTVTARAPLLERIFDYVFALRTDPHLCLTLFYEG